MTTKRTQAHTPGPWRYDPDHGDVTDTAGKVLIPWSYDYNDTVDLPDDEKAANMRLAAAAPALLAALKAMMAELPKVSTRSWVDPDGNALVDPMTMAAALSQARAAIALAQGQP